MLTSLAGSRATGMNTKHSRPARAAYAATALARLPVDAHAIVSKPFDRAQLIATDTTRSLNEFVGFMLSFFRYRFRSPSSAPSRSAFTSGVIPSPSVTTGVDSSTGSRSRYRHIDLGPCSMRSRLTIFFSAAWSYTTSSGPKHISQTCVACSSYSAPHSRQRIPRSLDTRVSLGRSPGRGSKGDHRRNRQHAAVIAANDLPTALMDHPVMPETQQ